jgi:hypothetical protein
MIYPPKLYLRMTRSTKLGMAILCLFATPFALGGLFAISQAIQMLQSGVPSSAGNLSPWVLILFGLVFAGVGFGLMFLAFYGATRVQSQQRKQAEHPAEPWLWRDDWAQGRANSQTRNTAIAAWVFAIFWNLVSMPVAFLALPQAFKQKGAIALVVLIFPVAGVYLLIRAIRQTTALFEFGKTYFEMASVPGVIGRELKGQIQARFPHSPDHGVHLRLTCVHRVTTNSGNTSNTMETILWRDEADLASAQLYPGPSGTTIPIAFRIPLDVHPTEKINTRDEFVWTLEALADVPGVDYHDIFEVPVFRTHDTPTQAEAQTIAAAMPAPSTARPDTMTIQVRQTADGTEFYFPAARNRSFATSLTVFLLIFSAVTFFLMHHAPFIFPLVFGFFSVLLLDITLQLWLQTTRVVIGNGKITVQSGWLGGGKVRQIACSEISRISDRITAQQGGASGTAFYDIELTLQDGKKVTLGHTVRDKHESDWLVGEMTRLVGSQPKSMTAGMA